MSVETLSMLAAVVTFAWATWCVFSPAVHDGVIGKVIYSTIALASFAIIAGSHISAAPMVTLNLCLAALAVRHFLLRTIWPHIAARLHARPHHRRESDGI